MKERQFIVSEKMLRDLLHSEAILNALNRGGVYNWSWYRESIRDYFIDMDSDTYNNEEKNYEGEYINKKLANFTEY